MVFTHRIVSVSVWGGNLSKGHALRHANERDRCLGEERMRSERWRWGERVGWGFFVLTSAGPGNHATRELCTGLVTAVLTG